MNCPVRPGTVAWEVSGDAAGTPARRGEPTPKNPKVEVDVLTCLSIAGPGRGTVHVEFLQRTVLQRDLRSRLVDLCHLPIDQNGQLPTHKAP
jgi:hypothetical protein